jgi:LacI family transcriptional regulator
MDVARAANVSKSTASRALSDPTKVNSETLARIQVAMAKLDYRPNGVARARRSRSTRLIGAGLPTHDYAIYIKQVEALQRELSEHVYSLLLTSSGFSLAEEL